MINSFSLILISIIYIFLLMGTFFKKERVNTPELRLFGYILISNFFGLLLEIICYLFVKFLPVDSIFTILVNKLYLIYFLVFEILFFMYTYSVSVSTEKYEKTKNKAFVFLSIVGICCSILLFFLPISISYGDKIYSYGPAVDLIYLHSTFVLTASILEMLIHIKEVKLKKYFPHYQQFLNH